MVAVPLGNAPNNLMKGLGFIHIQIYPIVRVRRLIVQCHIGRVRHTVTPLSATTTRKWTASASGGRDSGSPIYGGNRTISPPSTLSTSPVSGGAFL